MTPVAPSTVLEYNREMTGALRLLDSVLTEYDRVVDSVAVMERKLRERDAEIEQYLSLLSKRGITAPTLDSLEAINGISLDPDSTAAMRQAIASFGTARER